MGNVTPRASATFFAAISGWELIKIVSIFLLDISTPRAKNTANSGEDYLCSSGYPPVTGIYESIQSDSTHR
jgi:hypothetical protein